jgi:hypothetical protein
VDKYRKIACRIRLRFFLPALALLLVAVAPRAAGSITGPGWSLTIYAQPKGCYGCVTGLPGQATWFRAPWRESRTLGLLAHNYLGGAHFAELAVGDRLTVRTDYGEALIYRVIAVLRYLAVQPGRFDTDVMDDAGRRITQGQVYARVYDRPGQLTLQTSLGGEYGGWLFVLAVVDAD